jgi:hypothetical protein
MEEIVGPRRAGAPARKSAQVQKASATGSLSTHGHGSSTSWAGGDPQAPALAPGRTARGGQRLVGLVQDAPRADQELVPGRRELDLARAAPQELDAQLAFEAAAISLAAPACTP